MVYPIIHRARSIAGRPRVSVELVRVEQRRCALYRHFDEREVLLYVGISDTPVDRTNSHARTSEWVQYADRAEVQWLPSRASAEASERYAIENEDPIFNRQYAAGDVDQRIADYLHEREVEGVKVAVRLYRDVVQRFVDDMPARLRTQAEERARRDYEYAGKTVDDSLSAHVLRHVGNLLNDHVLGLVDQAKADAYGTIFEHMTERLEKIANDSAVRRGSAAAIAPEADF